MQNKNYWDTFETCCCKFMVQVFSSKFSFYPFIHILSLTEQYLQNPDLQSLRIVSNGCSSWRDEQTTKKNNCKMLEVICKTYCILLNSVKYLFLWEFMVCFYKILPVGSIRWFWNSTEWLESDGRNSWFLMIQFLLLVSMLSFSELPVWALSLSDTN